MSECPLWETVQLVMRVNFFELENLRQQNVSRVTHKNFQSVDPNVSDANGINERIGCALTLGRLFRRLSLPWERYSVFNLDGDGVCDRERDRFQIDVEKIDRLYYIRHREVGDTFTGGHHFELVARMDGVYVQFRARCGKDGMPRGGDRGMIFVSRRANFFMNIVLANRHPKQCIYKSLADDGIDATEQSEHERLPRRRWSTAPTLKFLCHHVIGENRRELRHYQEVLPTPVTRSVSDFVRCSDARKIYCQNNKFS